MDATDESERCLVDAYGGSVMEEPRSAETFTPAKAFGGRDMSDQRILLQKARAMVDSQGGSLPMALLNTDPEVLDACRNLMFSKNGGVSRISMQSCIEEAIEGVGREAAGIKVTRDTPFPRVESDPMPDGRGAAEGGLKLVAREDQTQRRPRRSLSPSNSPKRNAEKWQREFGRAQNKDRSRDRGGRARGAASLPSKGGKGKGSRDPGPRGGERSRDRGGRSRDRGGDRGGSGWQDRPSSADEDWGWKDYGSRTKGGWDESDGWKSTSKNSAGVELSEAGWKSGDKRSAGWEGSGWQDDSDRGTGWQHPAEALRSADVSRPSRAASGGKVEIDGIEVLIFLGVPVISVEKGSIYDSNAAWMLQSALDDHVKAESLYEAADDSPLARQVVAECQRRKIIQNAAELGVVTIKPVKGITPVLAGGTQGKRSMMMALVLGLCLKNKLCYDRCLVALATLDLAETFKRLMGQCQQLYESGLRQDSEAHSWKDQGGRAQEGRTRSRSHRGSGSKRRR